MDTSKQTLNYGVKKDERYTVLHDLPQHFIFLNSLSLHKKRAAILLYIMHSTYTQYTMAVPEPKCSRFAWPNR